MTTPGSGVRGIKLWVTVAMPVHRQALQALAIVRPASISERPVARAGCGQQGVCFGSADLAGMHAVLSRHAPQYAPQ